MIRKTLAVAVTAAAAAIAFAPLAHADTGPHNVTDQFVAVNAPDAFTAKGNLNLLFSDYGTNGTIECMRDGAVLTSCIQIDPWGARHHMQYITNVGPRGVWATVDGFQMPQLPPLPALPPMQLPPFQLPPMPNVGSSGNGSAGPNLGIGLDVTSSLGGIGLGVGLS